MRVLVVVFWLLLAPGAVAAGVRDPAAFDRWVLKVQVVRSDGMRELGSAVVIGPGRLVTNCHVVRNAVRIEVARGDTRWNARMDSGDEYRDLCFLKVPDYPGAPPRMAEPGDAKVSLPVVAVGYSGGRFTVSEGYIKGLFTCACDGGRVIQTSARFDPGASGGGLFDTEGRLLGILTFKSEAGGDFHFAVPVGWMKALGHTPRALSGKGTFWEDATRDSGYFMVACDLGARQDWDGLYRLARDWVRQEPDNPQAWMAWGRSNLHLGKPEEAARGFQKVLDLDSTHSEAWWELQKLEIDLGRPLLGG